LAISPPPKLISFEEGDFLPESRLKCECGRLLVDCAFGVVLCPFCGNIYNGEETYIKEQIKRKKV
jgi:hypothetical protein